MTAADIDAFYNRMLEPDAGKAVHGVFADYLDENNLFLLARLIRLYVLEWDRLHKRNRVNRKVAHEQPPLLVTEDPNRYCAALTTVELVLRPRLSKPRVVQTQFRYQASLERSELEKQKRYVQHPLVQYRTKRRYEY